MSRGLKGVYLTPTMSLADTHRDIKRRPLINQIKNAQELGFKLEMHLSNETLSEFIDDFKISDEQTPKDRFHYQFTDSIYDIPVEDVVEACRFATEHTGPRVVGSGTMHVFQGSGDIMFGDKTFGTLLLTDYENGDSTVTMRVEGNGFPYEHTPRLYNKLKDQDIISLGDCGEGRELLMMVRKRINLVATHYLTYVLTVVEKRIMPRRAKMETIILEKMLRHKTQVTGEYELEDLEKLASLEENKSTVMQTVCDSDINKEVKKEYLKFTKTGVHSVGQCTRLMVEDKGAYLIRNVKGVYKTKKLCRKNLDLNPFNEINNVLTVGSQTWDFQVADSIISQITKSIITAAKIDTKTLKEVTKLCSTQLGNGSLSEFAVPVVLSALTDGYATEKLLTAIAASKMVTNYNEVKDGAYSTPVGGFQQLKCFVASIFSSEEATSCE
jgi:hypothetical protein